MINYNRKSEENDFDYVDRIFCEISEKKNQFGLNSSNYKERVVLDIWHSYGLIENGGFHNYLIGAPIISVIKSYKECGLNECVKCLLESNSLYQKYINKRPSDKIDPDDFRNLYDTELDEIEERFYSCNDEMILKLSKYIEPG